MEVGLLEIITKSIASVGLGNTLIGIALTMVIGYLYRNKQKANKALSDTIDNQNKNVLSAIESQNALLFQMHRTSNETKTAIESLNAQITGFLTLLVGIINRDIDRGGE